MGFAPEYHGYRFMQDPGPNGGRGRGRTSNSTGR